MQTDLPRKVSLTEVGPRDGFQFETKVLPTDVNVDVVAGLVAAGLRHIQVVSFVHPARVPQMADAEALLCAGCDFVLHGHMHQVGLLQARTPHSNAFLIAAGVVAGLVFFGLGMGLAGTPATTAITASLPMEKLMTSTPSATA